MSHPVQPATLPHASIERNSPLKLPWRLYSAEGLASVGSNLLVSGVYFYTASRFHWGLKQNFLLATGQGVGYVIGALTADRFTRLIERGRALMFCYIAMSALSVLGFLAISQIALVTAALLAYSYITAISWPIIESLVATEGDSHSLSRRIAIYNVVWAALGVVTLAIEGTLIVRWPAGVFLVPALAHGASAMLVLNHGKGADAGVHSSAAASAPCPEPELLRIRTLALWLSRGVLPATYVVIYGLLALLPSLPVMSHMHEEQRTLVGSIWMVARLAAFLLLGMGTWWHTRPRVLLFAAIVTLIAFFGITLRPSDFIAHLSAFDLPMMIGSQLAFGAALGMIYSASLYFGMVLSEGSTEHGGYHEALIGVGFIVGPGAGAVAQVAFPGREIYAGIFAIGAVVALSVAFVAVMAARAAKNKIATPDKRE